MGQILLFCTSINTIFDIDSTMFEILLGFFVFFKLFQIFICRVLVSLFVSLIKIINI